jgi:hypothetical protein
LMFIEVLNSDGNQKSFRYGSRNGSERLITGKL